MTAPLRNAPHSTALPASQTAPVAEFRCLFTHDVRRKQKRWQDGYLKFHTFNNRVMVTDQSRNHIGDTYWKESNELQEGDELSLDKGVLVEVAEAMGVTQTDLTSVLAKKKDPPKEPLARPTPSASTRPFQRPTSVAPSSVPRAGAQLRHKSLNTLLGTPKGPVGKAVPMKSPYETRIEKEKENEPAEERAPKRQKTAPRPPVWRASSPVHEDESSPVKRVPSWTKTADASNTHNPHAATSRPAKVITISSESDHIPLVSSGVSLPSTPAKVVQSIPTPPLIAAPSIPSSVFAEPVTKPVETPKTLRPKIPLPKKKPIETPKRPAPTSSPPVSASNRLTNIDFAVQPVQKPQKKSSPPQSPPRKPKGKALRLPTGVRRGTLMCQTISRPASSAGSEPRASASRSDHLKTSRIRSKEPSPIIQEEPSEERRGDNLASSKAPQAIRGTRRSSHVEPVVSSKKAKSRTPTPPQQPDEDIFDDPEIIHGFMDQQLLFPPSPAEPYRSQSPPMRKSPIPKPIPRPINKDKSKARPREATSLETSEDGSVEPKPTVSKSTTKKVQPTSATEKPQAARTISPPAQPVLKPPEPRSRDISPAHTDTSGAQSRNNSISPAKKPLSTGGFLKKAKRTAKEAAVATPIAEAPAPVPPQESGGLPSHPLRSGKKGPLMSTTELAALLTKPKKRTRAEDPIEDDAQPTGKSPARKIRRVRSENDAPIPSTAEDWEKRNLPKTSSNLTDIEEAPAPAIPAARKKSSGLAALVKRTDPRKKFQCTQSLNVDTNVVVEEPDLPSPVIDTDVGPWSTEAFDLFDWRPPVREEVVT